jgi:hypothetical protein
VSETKYKNRAIFAYILSDLAKKVWCSCKMHKKTFGIIIPTRHKRIATWKPTLYPKLALK